MTRRFKLVVLDKPGKHIPLYSVEDIASLTDVPLSTVRWRIKKLEFLPETTGLKITSRRKGAKLYKGEVIKAVKDFNKQQRTNK